MIIIAMIDKKMLFIKVFRIYSETIITKKKKNKTN